MSNIDYMPLFDEMTSLIRKLNDEIKSLEDECSATKDNLDGMRASRDSAWDRAVEFEKQANELRITISKLNEHKFDFASNESEQQLKAMVSREFHNQKINAIKFVRGITNLGLKEAKTWVESIDGFGTAF